MWCACRTRASAPASPGRVARRPARLEARLRSSQMRREDGQALVLLLAVTAVVIAGSLILASFGQALGGKSKKQRAADLAAVSAARQMQRDFPRLFEPAVIE